MNDKIMDKINIILYYVVAPVREKIFVCSRIVFKNKTPPDGA
ncbi:hypothetical protein [Eubacterium sp. An3]|nr:hypothetical protein [Eubacterium sp. An3]